MRLAVMFFAAAIVTLGVNTSRGDVLLGVQAGAGFLRLDDLEEFWDEVGLHHNTDNLAFQWEVSATWRMAPRHALRLSVERITTTVVVYDAYTLPPLGMFSLYSDQNLASIPISIGYEFAMRRSEQGALTLVGFGVGYYMSEFEGDEVFVSDDPSLTGSHHDSREGNGYGFDGYLRQTAPLSERLSMSGMVRGRWADAMAFDDSDATVPFKFTDFDFAVGLEWKI